MASIKVGLVILLLSSAVSFAEDFNVPISHADWHIKKGVSYCQLFQKIPLYGTADFMHQSGDLLRFSIREERFKPEIIRASLSIDNPSWLHEPLAVKDYSVYLDSSVDIQNIPRLSVYGDAAETMLDALSSGLSPTFSYIRATADGMLPETQVAISAINFAKNYQKFSLCRKNFLPYGLKDELEKSLFFKPGSKVLTGDVLTQLKDTARYIKEVKGAEVSIVSDTAIAGTIDKKWFSNRANAIASKLNGLGVAKNKVKIRNGVYSTSTSHNIIQLRVFGPDALTAIYYKKGNIKLSQTEKQRLNLLVRYAREFMPNAQLLIKSYTDSKGKRASNLAVSQKRADVVKQYLLSLGMQEERLKVKAYGESRPAKSNRFPRGRAQNRRVIISFV